MLQNLKKISYLFLFIFGACMTSFVCVADTVLAQTIPVSATSSIPVGIVSAPGELAGCFDMYHFGSVQVILNTSSSTVDSGGPLSVSASVINQNNYPIVDGAIYVKIFKIPSATSTDQSQAGDVVDQFYAVQNINLAAHAQAVIPFNWQVPAYAVSGDYQVVPYFIADGKFNLLGLTFTDDIHGQPLDFSVAGSSSGSVMFDKSSVLFDNAPYFFAAFTPKISATSSVTVVATLNNTTSSDVTVPVSADVYSWDAASSVNLLRDLPQTVMIPAHSSTTVSFTITDAVPVTLVVINATYQDTHSILNVRFTRDGIAYPRINFPALSNFPLVVGQSTDLFTCFHAAGTLDTLPGAKVALTLTDASGNVIASSTYTGDVTGNMMGMKTTFVPKKNYDNLTLTAETSVGGVIADKAVVQYDCSAIIGASCPPVGVPLLYWISIIGSLAILFVLCIYFAHRKSKLSHEIAAILIIIIVFAGWGGMWRVAAAAGAGNSQVALQVPPNGVVWTQTFPVTDSISYGGSAVVMSIAYGGSITNADTGAIIASGASVPVGTNLLFSPAPFKNENISWFTSGYSYDSPYGYWGSTAPLCSPSDHIDGYTGYGAPYTTSAGWTSPTPFQVYRPMMVTIPNVHLVQNGTAKISQVGTNEYEVTAPGTISAQMIFDPTTAIIADEEQRTIEEPTGVLTPLSCYNEGRGGGSCTGGTPVYKPVTTCTISNPALFTFTVPQQTIAFTLNVPTPPASSTPAVTPSVATPSTSTTDLPPESGTTSNNGNSSNTPSNIIPITNEDIENSLPAAGATTSQPNSPTFQEF